MKDISQYRVARLTDQDMVWVRQSRAWGNKINLQPELVASDITEEELRAALRVNIPRLNEENISFLVRMLHIARHPSDRTLDEF
jgi:hypothetical protein